MKSIEMEAKLLALESVVQSLCLTHPDPRNAFAKFNEIYTEKVRVLNANSKDSPESAETAKQLMKEAGRFAHYFPKA